MKGLQLNGRIGREWRNGKEYKLEISQAEECGAGLGGILSEENGENLGVPGGKTSSRREAGPIGAEGQQEAAGKSEFKIKKGVDSSKRRGL